jgi:hypothetical protein
MNDRGIEPLRWSKSGQYGEAAVSVVTAAERFRQRLDTVLGFLEDVIELDRNVWTPRPALYKAYQKWCLDNERRPVHAQAFFQRLRESLGEAAWELKRRGIRGVQGLRLSPRREIPTLWPDREGDEVNDGVNEIDSGETDQVVGIFLSEVIGKSSSRGRGMIEMAYRRGFHHAAYEMIHYLERNRRPVASQWS